jgi:hypothetical protein
MTTGSITNRVAVQQSTGRNLKLAAVPTHVKAEFSSKHTTVHQPGEYMWQIVAVAVYKLHNLKRENDRLLLC